jgi:hypothetical protein
LRVRIFAQYARLDAAVGERLSGRLCVIGPSGRERSPGGHKIKALVRNQGILRLINVR